MRRAATIGALISLTITGAVGLHAYLNSPQFHPAHYILLPAGLAMFGIYGDSGTEEQRFRTFMLMLFLINSSLGILFGIVVKSLDTFYKRANTRRPSESGLNDPNDSN